MTKHPNTNDHKRQPTTATAIQAQQQSNSPLVHRHRRPPGGAACDRCGPCGGCRPRGGSMTAPRSRDLSDTPSTGAVSPSLSVCSSCAPLLSCCKTSRQRVKSAVAEIILDQLGMPLGKFTQHQQQKREDFLPSIYPQINKFSSRDAGHRQCLLLGVCI